MGGQPATRRPKYHKGFAGNTCTEDVVLMMEEMGIETGLGIDEVTETGLMAEEFCGRKLLGHVTRSGPVRHKTVNPLDLHELRPNREIPAALLFAGNIKDALPRETLIETVIREALAKNWSVPENLQVSTEGAAVKGEFGGRDILVTKLKVLAIEEERDEATLEALSQKSNGDVFFEGRVIFTFPS
jgi:hypothetical protein